MNLFISDLHFGHNKPFIYEARGFLSIEEHDKELIKRFNSKVKPEDVVYHLGDFCWGNISDYIYQLNGTIIFIFGNHDKNLKQFLHDNTNIKFLGHDGYYNMYIGNKQPLTLCHYPMHSWEKSHYNAMHLYGHHHLKTDFGGKTLNVSVDNLNGYPMNENELLVYMSYRDNNWDYINKQE